MRLINTTSLELETFLGAELPAYATLSHRWEEGEVRFEQLLDGTGKSLKGFAKIENSAYHARIDEIGYIWVDTCCINRESSAELSEAINSMYGWYKGAAKCFVYMSDVGDKAGFCKSKWFTRGWTLQELLAPQQVQFMNKDWQIIGTKQSLQAQLTAVTGISKEVLCGADMALIPVSQKLYWAADRITTRPEDIAYCLLGLVGVNMPLLYGEGAGRAFYRLQQSFLQTSDDETLFAWTADADDIASKPYWGLLAPSPRYFRHSGTYTVPRFKTHRHGRPVEMTNGALRISFTAQPLGDVKEHLYLAALNCAGAGVGDELSTTFAICLQKMPHFENQYARVAPDQHFTIDTNGNSTELRLEDIFIRAIPRQSDPVYGFCVLRKLRADFHFLTSSFTGPVQLPAHCDIIMQAGSASPESAEMQPEYSFVDVLEAETKLFPDAFNVKNLSSRQVIGYFHGHVTSWLDDGAYSRKIITPESYKQLYIVVGLEPSPANALGTPSGFVQPWYSFVADDSPESIAQVASGAEELCTQHRVPGGGIIKLDIEAATYRFRTYYQLKVSK